jgi:hypothetical protein
MLARFMPASSRPDSVWPLVSVDLVEQRDQALNGGLNDLPLFGEAPSFGLCCLQRVVLLLTIQSHTMYAEV